MPSRKITASDVFLFVITAVALLLSLVFLTSGGGGDYALVSADGVETKYSLDRDGKYGFSSNGVDFVLEIKDGGAAVVEAGCPDKVCVSSGRISSPGESIVCIPGRMSVKIIGKEGGGRDEADFIVGLIYR